MIKFIRRLFGLWPRRINPRSDIGKRAIHICSGKTGVITNAQQDPDADCWNWLTMKAHNLQGNCAGHRHYFILKGGNYPGDTLFETEKHKYPAL